MPEIIYGRNHSLREEVFFSRVKAAAESGGARDNARPVLI